MKSPRHADVLRKQGFTGSLDEFRAALIAVKDESYPNMTDELVAFGRNSSQAFCVAVRERLGVPGLERVFILKALVGLRKNGWRKRAS